MSKERLTEQPWFKRSLPFATYMLFILVYDLAGPFVPEGPIADNLTAIVYPVKILAVIAALVYCWNSYDELRQDRLTVPNLAGSAAVGALVFVLWINMDWSFAVIGEAEGYDPGRLPGGLYYAFIAVRLAGASVVVPLFEELFWRSFVLRYIINQDFLTVRIGTFSWMSFIVTSLLFGSEHNLWLAGIMAGVFYNALMYWSRSIYACIIAHGITNLLLGIYVIKTGSWQFW